MLGCSSEQNTRGAYIPVGGFRRQLSKYPMVVNAVDKDKAG